MSHSPGDDEPNRRLSHGSAVHHSFARREFSGEGKIDSSARRRRGLRAHRSRACAAKGCLSISAIRSLLSGTSRRTRRPLKLSDRAETQSNASERLRPTMKWTIKGRAFLGQGRKRSSSRAFGHNRLWPKIHPNRVGSNTSCRNGVVTGWVEIPPGPDFE